MDYKSETRLRVRYCETDKMGIVHHSRYYPWFEIARGDFLKGMGKTYRDMEEEGIYMPLTKTGAKYILPVTYDDEVIITCKITKLTYVRCVFEYEVIKAEDGTVVTTGMTEHAFCDTTMKPVNFKKKHPQFYEMIENTVCKNT